MASASEYYCYIGGRNISQFIEDISWSYNDIDAPKSGRVLSGVMNRGRIGDKIKLSFKLVPISDSDLAGIVGILRSQYVSVRTNLIPGGEVSFTGYNSTRSGKTRVFGTDGITRHTDVSFNIIER